MTRWAIHALIGMFIGTVAYLMAVFEEHVADYRTEHAQHLVEHEESVATAYFFYAGLAAVFALAAVLLTIYVGPYAYGSGVPEIMGAMNGVQGGGAFYLSTLFTKATGVVCAVLAGLCVGKEGPLAHIGSVCGACIAYMPYDGFKPFRNDYNKRVFIASGCSAGVAVAFGSPIGGTLFSYEMSKPNTFWTFGMLWKTFFTSAVAVFTQGLLQQLGEGGVISLSNSAALKFGNINIIYSPLSDALAGIVIGIVCGLLGALFVTVYSNMMVVRKHHVNTNLKKILEVVAFSIATTSAFFWLSALNASNAEKNCYPIEEASIKYFSFTCPEGEYNPQTTLFFNTEGGVIRALMNQEINEKWRPLLIFAGTWYVGMIFSAGLFLPGGLFVPAMIVGCCVGSLVNHIKQGVLLWKNPVIG